MADRYRLNVFNFDSSGLGIFNQMNDKLLEIEDLSVHFHIPEGVALAVDGISFHLAEGETSLWWVNQAAGKVLPR